MDFWKSQCLVTHSFSWWRHQMETFFALLALWEENLRATGVPLTSVIDVDLWWFFFHLRLNKRFSKQSGGRWIETLSGSLWRHCNVCRAAYTRRQTGDWHQSSMFISGLWWLVWVLFCYWCWWTDMLFGILPPILADVAGDMWRLSDFIISGWSCLLYASQRCPTDSKTSFMRWCTRAIVIMER